MSKYRKALAAAMGSSGASAAGASGAKAAIDGPPVLRSEIPRLEMPAYVYKQRIPWPNASKSDAATNEKRKRRKKKKYK